MIFLPLFAAFGASCGWATGIVLAQAPARAIGAFEFTRIQLIACGTILAVICTARGAWQTIAWEHWPAILASTCIGIVPGNLAMIACLRRGGPKRTQLLLALNAPITAFAAYLWLGETLSLADLLGGALVLGGIFLAILYGNDAGSRLERLESRLSLVITLGILATLCQGFGFLSMKPALMAGTDPIAASALRLTGAALLISLIALWPLEVFRPKCQTTPGLLARTVLPGFIGYAVSSSLLLYAFANTDAGIAAILGSLAPVLVLPILWVKEGRPPRPQALLGAAIVVAGTSTIALA